MRFWAHRAAPRKTLISLTRFWAHRAAPCKTLISLIRFWAHRAAPCKTLILLTRFQPDWAVPCKILISLMRFWPCWATSCKALPALVFFSPDRQWIALIGPFLTRLLRLCILIANQAALGDEQISHYLLFLPTQWHNRFRRSTRWAYNVI